MLISITLSSHPLMTCPMPTLNENGSCPGSFVDQNFFDRSRSLPYPVQCTFGYHNCRVHISEQFARNKQMPRGGWKQTINVPSLSDLAEASARFPHGWFPLWSPFSFLFRKSARYEIRLQDNCCIRSAVDCVDLFWLRARRRNRERRLFWLRLAITC